MKEKIEEILNKKYSYEIYAAIICFISLLIWAILPISGLSILLVIMSIMLFVTNDIKYILPIIINLIFVNGDNYSSDKVPIALIITGVIFIISVIAYMIKNKKKITFGKMKSFIPLAILGIIPIFWSALKEYPNEKFMYLLYFNWVLYYLIYLFIVNNVRKNIIYELFICLSYMAVLISFECVIQTIRVLPKFDALFSVYYRLGWGVCNEAGIMICVAMPFIFYLLIKEEMKIKVVNAIKIALAVLGIFLTMSRATYLFGAFEFILSFVVLVYKSKNRKKIIITASIALLGGIIFLLVEGSIIKSIKENVFTLGLTSNGRDLLYKDAIKHFTKNPLTVIFGDGIVNEFEVIGSNNTGLVEGSLRMIVYHSTIFQTLATMGAFGIIALMFHFVEKYKMILKCEKLVKIFILISFICVDIYGIIDNTYHMYYYMIILVIILGIIERSNENKEEIIYE